LDQRQGVVGKVIVEFDHAGVDRPGGRDHRRFGVAGRPVAGGCHAGDRSIGDPRDAVRQDRSRRIHADHPAAQAVAGGRVGGHGQVSCWAGLSRWLRSEISTTRASRKPLHGTTTGRPISPTTLNSCPPRWASSSISRSPAGTSPRTSAEPICRRAANSSNLLSGSIMRWCGTTSVLMRPPAADSPEDFETHTAGCRSYERNTRCLIALLQGRPVAYALLCLCDRVLWGP